MCSNSTCMNMCVCVCDGLLTHLSVSLSRWMVSKPPQNPDGNRNPERTAPLSVSGLASLSFSQEFPYLFLFVSPEALRSLQPLIIIHKDLVKVSSADGAALLARCGYCWGFGANSGGFLQQLEQHGYSGKHLCYCGPAVFNTKQ